MLEGLGGPGVLFAKDMADVDGGGGLECTPGLALWGKLGIE